MRYKELLENKLSDFSIKPSTDNIYEVASANSNYYKIIGNKIIDINEINSGGVDMSDIKEIKRVNDLINKILKNKYISRIIIDDKFNVIEGQHRFEALKKIGIDKIPVTQYLDYENIYDIPKLEKEIKEKFKLSSDKTYYIITNFFEVLSDTEIDNILKEYDFPGYEHIIEYIINLLMKETKHEQI